VDSSISTFARIARFTLTRALSLLVVMIISIYLTILIASRSVVIESEFEPAGPIGGWFTGIANPVITFRPDAPSTISPFETAVRLLARGLTLNLGHSARIYNLGQRGFLEVNDLILITLPRTLLLFGTANLLVFITSISMALVLTRRYGGFLEKVFLALSPLSTIPAWIYGLFITVFMARVLHIWIGGNLTVAPMGWDRDYFLLILRHITPAIIAIFISKFFLSVYTWRSFLLIFSGEDYLELAKAKGLPNSVVEKRYLLRPALPNILTIFTVMMIAIWQEAIIIELFFSIMGIGQLFYLAIRNTDIPVIVGLTVIFGYLLAISVFILDFAHGILDPRVSLGDGNYVNGGKESGRVVRQRARRQIWKRQPRTTRDDWEYSPVQKSAQKSPFSFNRFVTRDVPTFWADFRKQSVQNLIRLRELLFELRRFPAAIAGLVVIMVLFGISASAPSILPYEEAVRRWNYDTSMWQRNPTRASPEWFNLFRRDPLPASTFINSRENPGIKSVSQLTEDMIEILFVFPIDYPYREFPQEISLGIEPIYQEKRPHISIQWRTPDDRQLDFGAFQAFRPERYQFRNNSRLMRLIQGEQPNVGLFADPDDKSRALPGQYELVLSAIVFEDNSDFEAELQLYGQVHGIAGTDHRRRDISIALLWGAPVALAFGILGAFGTTFTTMVVAATSAWFEGWVDTLIQRLTEISMILPVFPILLIIYNFHWKSVWAILGVAVLLGVFSGAIKTYRSIFLSVKGAPYMEAARAYGTGSFRMIGRYLIPRILPVLIPQLIILVPTYVYLEATLAFLNMSDPVLPTWGKLIREAVMNGALDGAYHWLLLPAGVLLVSGFAFLMLGYAFERVLNPRLRES
jgi:peptide/nickel transport system permease protein